ncbi:DsrE/DsrF/DsrH-like protein [Flavobacterium sp. 270]|uniref:DsrE family protein n=1 Tax=Flavobacterium sp. 270 TaxID=2512114 RepID=UPI001064BA3A|nr:DsrE family protein [Flavobacterium sp. 270]TDW51641.1 DsrE/DsrF/DsrH-like protein [Flavobacterium sp. 270]
MKKTAIIILSDPKAGSEEALGRIFNALASAYEFKHAGEDVKIIFQGTGIRWPEQLDKPEHPVHALYTEVKAHVHGLSKGCVAVFGTEVSGYDLLNDNEVPGTPGLPSFINLRDEGYDILIF